MNNSVFCTGLGWCSGNTFTVWPRHCANEEKKERRVTSCSFSNHCLQCIEYMEPQAKLLGVMLELQFCKSFRVGMSRVCTSNSSPGMSQCQRLDFTSWTFFSCAVLWSFCLFVCLFISEVYFTTCMVWEMDLFMDWCREIVQMNAWGN